VQTTSVLPSLCQVPSISNYTFCWFFMKFGVGILYRELSSEREFGENECWGGQSVVMTCTLKPCHILEVKNAYRKMMKSAINSSDPRTSRRFGPPNFLIAFSAVGCTAGFLLLAGDKLLGIFTKLQKATSSCLPLCPYEWNNSRPMEEFQLNFLFLNFSKICRENSTFIKIGKK